MDAVTNDVREYWDNAAATFDEAADHGLLDPSVRAAWSRMLMPLLPVHPATVADLGCGTGSLSVLLGEAGYEVTGLDVAPLMIAAARQKALAAGLTSTFVVGDASAPDLPPSSFDVVLGRHVLWALPDPAAALGRWIALLRPEGLLLLIEGHWDTGAGLAAQETLALVRRHGRDATVVRLVEPEFWGREITDERYLVSSRGSVDRGHANATTDTQRTR